MLLRGHATSIRIITASPNLITSINEYYKLISFPFNIIYIPFPYRETECCCISESAFIRCDKQHRGALRV